MKTLRFCFALFGLFFLSNGVVKAQIVPAPLEVNVDNISFAPTPIGYGLQAFSITVSSNFPVNLAISLHACGSCQEGDFFPVAIFPDENQESGSQTTEHTFYVELPIGEQAYLRCGYINNNTDAYKASDGGCVIGIDP